MSLWMSSVRITSGGLTRVFCGWYGGLYLTWFTWFMVKCTYGRLQSTEFGTEREERVRVRNATFLVMLTLPPSPPPIARNNSTSHATRASRTKKERQTMLARFLSLACWPSEIEPRTRRRERILGFVSIDRSIDPFINHQSSIIYQPVCSIQSIDTNNRHDTIAQVHTSEYKSSEVLENNAIILHFVFIHYSFNRLFYTSHHITPLIDVRQIDHIIKPTRCKTKQNKTKQNKTKRHNNTLGVQQINKSYNKNNTIRNK